MKFKNFFKHLKTVIKHRFWVRHYCFKVGLFWRGITHDLSKYSPAEFLESVKYYKGTSSPITECKDKCGYSLAWQHHKGRNKHHYEYWTDRYDTGTVAIKMPYKDATEMICDYFGASRAYGANSKQRHKWRPIDEVNWWVQHRDEKLIHPQTKEYINIMMDWIGSYGISALNKRVTKIAYKMAEDRYRIIVKAEETAKTLEMI